MTCRPLRLPRTAVLGTLAALVFATSAVAQAPDITVHVSADVGGGTFSMDIEATTSAAGAHQMPIQLDGQTYYVTEEGFDRFTTFTNLDDSHATVSGEDRPSPDGTGTGWDPGPDRTAGNRRVRPGPGIPVGPPLLRGTMFDGLPINVVSTARDDVSNCRAMCVEAPDCLAFTYHPGERQCDMFWDVYGEISDPCCVSGYLD